MKLPAKLRTIKGKKVKNLRLEGIVPASVYGPKRPSTNIEVDKKEFIGIFKSVGFNQFFDLAIESEPKSSKVLVKEIQKNPVTDILTSVSFYQVDEDTKVVVEVPVELVGEAPAVKLNVGFLINMLDQIEVYCLPKDLPSSIKIDVTKLENIGDGISISDIQLPEGVELSSSMDPDAGIVSIAAPQKEEEVEVAPELDADGNPIVPAVEGEATTEEASAKE